LPTNVQKIGFIYNNESSGLMHFSETLNGFGHGMKTV